MSNSRPYWNMEIEPILNTPAIRDIQLKKIKTLVKKVYETKSFWRSWLESAGVRPDDIRTFDDFSNRVPVFDKQERHKLFEACDHNMARVVDNLIGVPIEKLRLMAATSGTTGEPSPYPFTENDIRNTSEIFARMLWRMGIREGSIIVNAFGLSMFVTGVPYVTFFQKVGACVLPVGGEAGTDRILKFLKLFKADTLACTPSLATHLIEKAPSILGESISTLGIQRIFCAGEPGAGLPEVKVRLEGAYGARLFDHGGGFGISCDHAEYQGMHHIADDYNYFELVDKNTGEPVAFQDGAIGVAVQTTLEGEGSLWFRESLGDVVQVFTEPCPCGRSGFRYKIIGRTDDMLKVKGVMIYPATIAGVIKGFVPRITGEFRIVLNEPPPRVEPPLTLKIEWAEGIPESQLVSLAGEIEEAMHNRLKIRPKIIWIPPNTLERVTHKTKFFEKNYK